MGTVHSNATFSAKGEQLGNLRLQFTLLILFHQATIRYVQLKLANSAAEAATYFLTNL